MLKLSPIWIKHSSTVLFLTKMIKQNRSSIHIIDGTEPLRKLVIPSFRSVTDFMHFGQFQSFDEIRRFSIKVPILLSLLIEGTCNHSFHIILCVLCHSGFEYVQKNWLSGLLGPSSCSAVYHIHFLNYVILCFTHL